MSGPRQVRAGHARSDRPPRQPGVCTPGRARGAVWAALALIIAAVLVALPFEAPRTAWVALLVAALVLLDVALALGIRQWLRDRLP